MKKSLDNYHKKIEKETNIKSVLIGFGFGTVIALILSLIFYVNLNGNIWIILIVWILSTIISGFIIKKYFFKTSLKETAKRVDYEFQLEERAITMVEYENEQSFLVRKQQENAMEYMKKHSAKELQFKGLKKPLIIVSILFLLTLSTVIFTTIEVQSYINENPEEILSEEDQIIEDMIEDLREIIEDAPIEDSLKESLNEIVDDLHEKYKEDDTLAQKIARVEDTKRDIIEKIEEALEEESTIIDELKTHDSTETLGFAFETNNQEEIEKTINEMITDFLELDVTGMEKYIEELAGDIEQSIEDAEIEDQQLEEELQEIVEKLKALIPKLDGSDPQDSADELEELLEEISEVLTESEEQQTEEELEQTIDEALDKLKEQEEEEEEEEIPPTEEDSPEGHEDEGQGASDSISNPLIIDGTIEFDDEIYAQIKEETIQLIESGTISNEEILEIINSYMENVERNNNEE